MDKNANLVEIYYLADEFCKEFYKVMKGNTLEQNNAIKRRNRKFKLNDALFIQNDAQGGLIFVVVPFYQWALFFKQEEKELRL